MSDAENNMNNASTESNFSPNERKARYRDCLHKTKILQENVSNQTINTLHGIMADTETIHEDDQMEEKVDHTEEVLLDSEVMCVSSDVLKRCTDTLNTDTSPYDHVDFADKILTYVQMRPDTILEEPYWPTLADDALKCLNPTPHYSCLLGTLKPMEKKVMAKRKHAPKDAKVATKRPENVQAVAKVEDGVEETVQKIKGLVSRYYKNGNGPLDFFKLIINPEDFGRTVENTLHVSFLVRDGYFKLVKGDEGRLYVHPTSKEALTQAKKKGNDANVQNVTSISTQQWQILKEAYQLKEPMINFGTSGNT